MVDRVERERGSVGGGLREEGREGGGEGGVGCLIVSEIYLCTRS